ISEDCGMKIIPGAGAASVLMGMTVLPSSTARCARVPSCERLEEVMRQLLLILSATASALYATNVFAAGAWQGQDVIHVPISWCVVDGTPAASTPNILPLGATAPDTTTDAILWRRHERATDFIYVNQAGITFRSAINNTWAGSLTFPIISDRDTTQG